jgi:hypothetical protein
MPKDQETSRSNRVHNASTPYQRQGPPAKHIAGTQQGTNASSSQPGSVSDAILARISGPSVVAHENAADHPAHQAPSKKGGVKAPQSGPRPGKPLGMSTSAPPFPNPAEDNVFQVKHAKYWQKCTPLKRRVYASMIVDIKNINDIHEETGESSSPLESKPIKYRTLCFLTKKPIPIDTATDTLPMFNPPLPYLLAPRYGFNCRPGPPVDLTNSVDFKKVRQYTINLMKIMAKQATFDLPKSDMAYLILPISPTAQTGSDRPLEDSIEWEEINAFAATEGRMLSSQDLADEIRLNALVDDGLFGYYPTESSTRFQVVGVRRDLCPSSELEAVEGPSGSIMSLQPRKWREAFESRMEDVWEDQPIFEVETAYDLSQGTRPVSSLRSRCRYKPYLKIGLHDVSFCDNL